MEEKTVSNNNNKYLQKGVHDAVVNGEMLHDIPSKTVYVTAESGLADWTGKVPVGTVAIQYGFKNIWQLKPDNTWEKC